MPELNVGETEFIADKERVHLKTLVCDEKLLFKRIDSRLDHPRIALLLRRTYNLPENRARECKCDVKFRPFPSNLHQPLPINRQARMRLLHSDLPDIEASLPSPTMADRFRLEGQEWFGWD